MRWEAIGGLQIDRVEKIRGELARYFQPAVKTADAVSPGLAPALAPPGKGGPREAWECLASRRRVPLPPPRGLREPIGCAEDSSLSVLRGQVCAAAPSSHFGGQPPVESQAPPTQGTPLEGPHWALSCLEGSPGLCSKRPRECVCACLYSPAIAGKGACAGRRKENFTNTSHDTGVWGHWGLKGKGISDAVRVYM